MEQNNCLTETRQGRTLNFRADNCSFLLNSKTHRTVGWKESSQL